MKIDTFILKVASHCNLNCSYCHMYNMGDETYKMQPKFISDENMVNFSKKLSSYTSLNKIEHAFISFHGGEPLLVDKKKFINWIGIIKAYNSHLAITFLVQTNGMLLKNDWPKILKTHKVNVGISLDGNKEINDMFRKKHNGKGSYDEITKNILNIKNDDVVKGIISVVNIHVEPNNFYYHMKYISNLQLNILLPNINHSNVPSIYQPVDKFLDGVSDWLIALYEVWKSDATRISIPFLEIIIKLIYGAENYGNHLIGNCENGVAVIETNGDIEVIDALRVSFSGATRGKLNISTNEIQELHLNELFNKYYYSHTKLLPKNCENCSIKNICGGGFLVHRYNDGNGYDNSSIYCNTLKKIINYIQKDLYELN